MEITIELDDALLTEAEKAASEDGQSFTRFLEDALRLALLERTDANCNEG
jgi:metal-responsive CopG/Arc/MetJ family transcriptional regulator